METKNTTSAKSVEIEKTISDLKQRQITLPEWKGKLENEYYPEKHPVMSAALYPDKVTKNGVVKVTRITRGLQRRAVKIMSGLMFGLPVERVYKTATEKGKRAAAIIEEILGANSINTVNINRSIMLYASCEFSTLWYAIKEENNLYGEEGLLKIKCRTFSPMNDESIYAKYDEYDDLIALSFEYIRKENGKDVTYFDSYTKDEYNQWSKQDNEWVLNTSRSIQAINKIPAVYGYRKTPIWESSNNVEEIEWSCSRNGNYLRRNSVPIFEVRADEDISFAKENDDDERIIVQLPSSGGSEYKTWNQAIESLKFHVEGQERAFFSDIQLPNFSFEEMKGSNVSGESKRYWFVDAIIKVLEEQGMWLDVFRREINVIKAFAKKAFPALANEFDTIRVSHIITPFNILEEKDNITNISTAVAGGISSKRTGVQRLGWVEDIEKELKEISADNMNDFTEPTI